MLKRTNLRSIFPLIFSLSMLNASADPAAATHSSVPVGRVVISGTVPDEATKAVLLAKLQELYGTGQIVDQISVGGVIAPPNWSAHIPKLINQNLKSIGKGQLAIDGTTISMHGEVGSEAIKQTIVNDYSGILNSSYTIKNGLRVTASSQAVVDQTLANRVIEFENASSQLTQSGKRVLDEMTETLKKLSVKKIDLIGHTDDTGTRAQNMALSISRADSVKIYLVARGLPSEIMGTTGMGPDQPVMSNANEEGRKRNRRIEFRVSQ